MRHLREELNRVQGLELDPTRKDEVAASLRNGLDRLGDETAASLFNMMARANSSIEAFGPSVFLRSMEALWDRLIDPSVSRLESPRSAGLKGCGSSQPVH